MRPMEGDSPPGLGRVDRGLQGSRSCVINLRNELRKLPTQVGAYVRRPNIWKVHSHIREKEREAYEPKLVSIGPLHHGKDELRHMEEAKLESLRNLHNRQDDSILDFYFHRVFGCLGHARNEYSEKVELSDEEFAKMLVVDGCFLMEFLMYQAFPAIYTTTFLSQVRWGFSHLSGDLMLLENQIPFFVLNELFEETQMFYRLEVKNNDLNLVDLALRFLGITIPAEYRRPRDVQHLLHLRHFCQDPCPVLDQPRRQSYRQLAMSPVKKLSGLISLLFLRLLYKALFCNCFGLFGAARKLRAPRTTPSATELREAGVKFKRTEIPEQYEMVYQLQISFEDGTLEIPSFLLTNSTSTELRNLIAFEQCCRHVSSHFTSYCSFMDHLINTPDDVAVFRRSGILESQLGSDAEVAELFNGLCKGIFIDHQGPYLKIYENLRGFCQVPHHRWRANLVQKYFTNPWTIISLIAGFFLLLFTAIQTFWKRN